MENLFTLVIALVMIAFCGTVLWQIGKAIFTENPEQKAWKERQRIRKEISEIAEKNKFK